MNFLEKLDYLMEREHLNKNTLSHACGIPYTTIVGWYKKGYENTKLSTVQKLVDFFDTTLDYLIRDEITDVHFGKTADFPIDYFEMEQIKKYRSLDSHGKEIVNLVLEKEYARSSELKSVQESNDHLTPIAAHHNNPSKEQLQLMREDLDEL